MPKPFLILVQQERTTDFSEPELDNEFTNNGYQRTAIIYAMLKEILKEIRKANG